MRDLANLQTEDEGLWFVAETAPEQYLQDNLRSLHQSIEVFLWAFDKTVEE